MISYFENTILVLKKIYPFTLFPRWQKLPYICNNFFYYNNLRITFLNYRTIEKSPAKKVKVKQTCQKCQVNL